jgi:hypothetical protein
MDSALVMITTREETTMHNTLHTVSTIVKNFFSRNAETLARETQFVQRSSKMTGSLFLKTLVFGLLENPNASLNDLREFCAERFGVDVSIQGLHDRIQRAALPFCKRMFTLAVEIFRQTAPLPLPVLHQFSAINIVDSTWISLPESMAAEWPGSGGDASPAGLKLQVIFEFLRGCFKTITLTAGIAPDQKYAGHVQQAEPNSLNLFDLGYFAVRSLQALADKGAYFVCRLLPGTGVHDAEGHPVDVLKLLRSDVRNRFELLVRIGAQSHLLVRVCFFSGSRRRRESPSAPGTESSGEKRPHAEQSRPRIDGLDHLAHQRPSGQAVAGASRLTLCGTLADRTALQTLEKPYASAWRVQLPARTDSGGIVRQTDWIGAVSVSDDALTRQRA